MRTESKLRQHGARLPRSRRPLADGRRRRRAHCHHMFNLDGAHTLQAELRSLHRKPRGYVEEGADAEDLLAVEAQVQPKPARQTSLTGFFGAPLKPAASLPIAAATAAAATKADTAIATTAAAAATEAAAEEEQPEAEGEETEPAWVAGGGKTLEVLDELVAHVLARDGPTLFTASERAWLHRLAPAGVTSPSLTLTLTLTLALSLTLTLTLTRLAHRPMRLARRPVGGRRGALITGRRARVLITGRIAGRPVGGRRQGATRHRRRRRVLITGRRRRVEGRRLGARRHRRRRRVSRSRLCQLRRALCTRDCSHGAAWRFAWTRSATPRSLRRALRRRSCTRLGWCGWSWLRSPARLPG